MKSMGTSVAFVVIIGLAVAVTSALTAPAATRGYLLLAGLLTTVLLAGIVALALWTRQRMRDRRPH